MLLLSLANERQRRQIQHAGGPIELGRLQQGTHPRVIVEDPYTSRDQLRLEELPGGKVRLINLGGPISLPDAAQLAPGETRIVAPPLRLVFGCTTLDVAVLSDNDGPDASMQTIQRPRGASEGRSLKGERLPPGRTPSAETLTQWFETLLNVQRAAAGSNEFYGDTACAVVELVGLDRGLVLLQRGRAWEAVACHSAAGEDDRQYSQRVLNQVVAERRTYYQSFQDAEHGQSLEGIEAVVASPIFDEHDAVAGVVYGSRDMRSAAAGQRGIEPLEAQFVQLLAGAVSAGLARLAREAEAARARVQFEQFFSPELARALEHSPRILAAQQRELTLLFADLRGFSRIAERIGAGETFSLLADILDRLTNHIMDHGGVVIDYYGDGLAAMWNAPTDVPQHADQACRAALAMLNELPGINSNWAEKLGGLVRLGIGLHTGRAQVGNAGSRRRLKYGPRGHAVNLTSRVEAATKVLGVPCLLTGDTRSALAWQAPFRRLGCMRLTGMAQPVELFELPTFSEHPAWLAHSEQYAAALALYEQQRAVECLEACRAMQQAFGTSDGPTNWLLVQAEQRAAAGSASYEAVFAVETK
jgi:adenylate cyclase